MEPWKRPEPKGEDCCKHPLLLSSYQPCYRVVPPLPRPSIPFATRGCENLQTRKNPFDGNGFHVDCGGCASLWSTGQHYKALCQARRLEPPVLRQSALLHDLTLHDITALHGKLGQEKRLWIAFCTRARAKTHGLRPGWDLLTCLTRLTRAIWARRWTYFYAADLHLHSVMYVPSQLMA